MLIAAVGLLGGTPAASAGASSVSVGVSADPTQDTPVTVTVSGVAAGPQKLWLLRGTRPSCESTAFSESTRSGTKWVTTFNGDTVDGVFSRTYSFDADDLGPGRICAYVGEYSTYPSTAAGGQDYTVRAGHASLAIEAPSAVVAGGSATFTVTGTAEVERRLWVVHRAPRVPRACDAQPTIHGGDEWLARDDERVHGDFSRTFTTGVLSEPGRVHQICVYVTRPAGADAPDATLEHTITVVPPAGPPPPPPPPPDPRLFPPSLLAPGNGATGTVLNPTFGWSSAFPPADMLVISRRDRTGFKPVLAAGNGKIAWLDGMDARTQEQVRAQLVRSSFKTLDFASYTVNAGHSNLRLNEPLEPGDYSWQVFGEGFLQDQSKRRPSETREFKVVGPHLDRLTGSLRSRVGRSTDRPGETRIDISVTRFSGVRVELRRAGRRSVRTFAVGNQTRLSQVVTWSCRQPGGTYRVRIDAWDWHGARKSVAGSFRPVSVARCRTMRRNEQRAAAARQRDAARRAAAQRRADAAAHRRRVARYQSNCRKLGGSPKLMRSGDGDYWICVAPWGGVWINVPY
ncbi:MAG: hypothetical protein WC558_09005 [Patulibacter sp.]